MYCKRCGTWIPGNATHCDACGTPTASAAGPITSTPGRPQGRSLKALIVVASVLSAIVGVLALAVVLRHPEASLSMVREAQVQIQAKQQTDDDERDSRRQRIAQELMSSLYETDWDTILSSDVAQNAPVVISRLLPELDVDESTAEQIVSTITETFVSGPDAGPREVVGVPQVQKKGDDKYCVVLTTAPKTSVKESVASDSTSEDEAASKDGSTHEDDSSSKDDAGQGKDASGKEPSKDGDSVDDGASKASDAGKKDEDVAGADGSKEAKPEGSTSGEGQREHETPAATESTVDSSELQKNSSEKTTEEAWNVTFDDEDHVTGLEKVEDPEPAQDDGQPTASIEGSDEPASTTPSVMAESTPPRDSEDAPASIESATPNEGGAAGDGISITITPTEPVLSPGPEPVSDGAQNVGEPPDVSGPSPESTG